MDLRQLPPLASDGLDYRNLLRADGRPAEPADHAARRALRLEKRDPIDGMLLVLPMSREDMADFLGLTIETVSRQISALKKAGVIELIDARHLLIPSWSDLLDAAGGDSELD